MHIRMSTKNINSDDKKNQKKWILNDIDINKILVSKKEQHGAKNALKYFIGYNGNDVIRPLCVRIPQMTGHVKKFNEIVTMLTIYSF